MDRFDPYLEWLGIQPGERPPDHYQLLALGRFEDDPQAIAQAADKRMSEIRKFQTGPRGRHTQTLLNQLATARFCLLDAQAKARYDQQLRVGPKIPVQASAFGPTPAPPANLAPPPMPNAPSPPVQLPASHLPAGHLPAGHLPAGHLPAGQLPPSHTFPDVPAPPPPPPPPRAVSRPVSQPRTSFGADGSPSPGRRSRVRRRDSTAMYLIALLIVCLGLAGVAWWVVQSRSDPQRAIGGALPSSTTVGEGPDKTGSGTSGLGTSGSGNPLPTMPSATPPHDPKAPERDPKAPGRDPLEGPVVIVQEGNGEVNLPPAVAVLHGDSIQLGDQQQPDAITHWTSTEDWIEWHFRLVKPGVFRMEIRYAVDEDAVDGQFDLVVDGKVVKTCSLRAAGAGRDDVTDEYFVPLPKSGQHRLALRPASKPGAQLMRLFDVRLTPSSRPAEGS